MTSYEALNKEQDPYTRDLLLELTAHKAMTDVHQEIFVLQHTDPTAANAAYTAVDAVADLYRDQFERTLTTGTKEDFDKVNQHLTAFATSFSTAVKDSSSVLSGQTSDKPDLPESFPDPGTAATYIDNINQTLEQARNTEGNLDPIVESAITKLTEEFNLVNATYSYNVDPTNAPDYANDWEALMATDPTLSEGDAQDRAAAEDFYRQMAGLTDASDQPTPDPSATKEDRYRLQRIAAGIDYLMSFVQAPNAPTHAPAAA